MLWCMSLLSRVLQTVTTSSFPEPATGAPQEANGAESGNKGVRPERGTVAVLGGGISGLACALRLAKEGRKVTLIEGTDQLGGLGGHCEYDRRTFEKFYHCMLPTDAALLGLLDEVGLRDEVYWKPTTFAYARGHKLYPLNTPADLLRFEPLSMVDRVRVGVTGLKGRRITPDGLDDITAEAWLTELSGKKAFATFWKPMLESKFGDRYQSVPALWFWSRFNREKGDKKGEVKGYIRGGYRRIAEVLARQIAEVGGEVRLRERVVMLDLDRSGRPVVVTSRGESVYDEMVITTPWPMLERTLGASLRRALPPLDLGIDFQGVINCLLFLKRPLSTHYWVATPEPAYPFDGLVETSTLTEEGDRGPRHVVYLTKYLHRDDPRFREDDDMLGIEWWVALKKLFPDLRDGDLERRQVFRAPHVEPLYTTGYTKRRPPEVLVPGRVYLASTVQVYPDVTSWNGSVAQANRTLDHVLAGKL